MRLVKAQEELEIGEQVETIQTTALLRSVWIPRKVLDRRRRCYLNSREKTSTNADVKNYQRSKIVVITYSEAGTSEEERKIKKEYLRWTRKSSGN